LDLFFYLNAIHSFARPIFSRFIQKIENELFQNFLGNPDYLDVNVLCPSTTTGSTTGVERKYFDETNFYVSNLSFNQ
jgi:hypothetical protein